MLFWLLQQSFMFSYVSGNEAFKPTLSTEEESKYINELLKGSEEARNILIERNMRLVAYNAKKYYDNNIERDDLISVGSIGLIKGIMNYKPNKKTKLSTYCLKCIDNEMLMLLRKQKKHEKNTSLQNALGSDSEGNEVSMEDKLYDDDYDIEEKVGTTLEIEKMKDIMKNVLKPKELKIITMRYGIECFPRTQKEIGSELNMSRSYVSRVEKRALEKLNKAMGQ